MNKSTIWENTITIRIFICIITIVFARAEIAPHFAALRRRLMQNVVAVELERRIAIQII